MIGFFNETELWVFQKPFMYGLKTELLPSDSVLELHCEEQK